MAAVAAPAALGGTVSQIDEPAADDEALEPDPNAPVEATDGSETTDTAEAPDATDEAPETTPEPDETADASDAPGPTDEAPEPAPKRKRRRKTTAVVVAAAVDAMDTAEPAAGGAEADRAAEALAAEQAAEAEAPAAAARPADSYRVTDVEVAPRRDCATRLLLTLIGVLIVLAAGAALGFGAASLLPGLVDASPPPATLAPPTERPTAPPVPTARPSASASPTPSPEPSPTPLVHIVKRGENLTQIAAKYKVTVAAIVAANQLKNANLIEVGQQLVIPTPTPEP
ncbi:MAG TPA: LysM peptidoglycan-binding domain-containing protein [Candidatus Limnocylindrales bacterium]|jgi:hypothetical protein